MASRPFAGHGDDVKQSGNEPPSAMPDGHATLPQDLPTWNAAFSTIFCI
jgi:hypothetical protein